jgi:hypothetical protein
LIGRDFPADFALPANALALRQPGPDRVLIFHRHPAMKAPPVPKHGRAVDEFGRLATTLKNAKRIGDAVDPLVQRSSGEKHGGA